MESVELEEPLASMKSAVWEHFDFPVQYNGDGTRVEDRRQTVCRRCFTVCRWQHLKHANTVGKKCYLTTSVSIFSSV